MEMKEKAMRKEYDFSKLKKRPYANQTMKILIWHDKHGDAYWDASTSEKEGAAFVRYVEELHKRSYLYDTSDDAILEMKQGIKKLNSRKEALEKGDGSTGVLKIEIDRLKEVVSQEEGYLEDMIRISNMLSLALDAKKPMKERAKVAREIAQTRVDAEYEGWELVSIKDPLVK